MSEISRFCQTVSRIVPLPKRSAIVGQAVASARDGHPADRQHDADVELPGLLLRVDADVARAVASAGRGSHRVERHRRSGVPQFLLDLGENFSKPQRVEHVLQPRLLAVGAVAVLDEDADDRRRRRRTHSSGLSSTPVVAGEVLCPVMPPSVRRK